MPKRNTEADRECRLARYLVRSLNGVDLADTPVVGICGTVVNTEAFEEVHRLARLVEDARRTASAPARRMP